MRLPLALLLALVCSVAVGAPPTVTLPAEVKVPVGRLASVTVEWEGSDLKYDVPPELDAFREYDPDPKIVRLRLIGYAPGRFRILAVAAGDGKLSDFAPCVVVVGNPPPQPEPPGPGPGPGPPKPPVVDVPDELAPAVAALAAFPKQRAELGKFYRDFAKVVESSNLTTTGQFRTAHANALKTFVAATGYTAPKVGTHIDAYLAECIGGLEDKPLNAELKARLAAALKTIGEVMQ